MKVWFSAFISTVRRLPDARAGNVAEHRRGVSSRHRAAGRLRSRRRAPRRRSTSRAGCCGSSSTTSRTSASRRHRSAATSRRSRTYFRFLLGEGSVVRDPSERLETPKRWRTLPEVLTVEEVSRLLAAPTLDDPLAFRDRAMLELAYGAGLRVSEWITLGVRDMHARGQARARLRQGEQGAPRSDRTVGDRRGCDLCPRASSAAREGGGKGVLFLNARGVATVPNGRVEDLGQVRRTGGNSRSMFRRIRCGIRSPRISSRAAPICARCRKCLATPISPLPRFTRTSTESTYDRCIGSSIREADT